MTREPIIHHGGDDGTGDDGDRDLRPQRKQEMVGQGQLVFDERNL